MLIESNLRKLPKYNHRITLDLHNMCWLEKLPYHLYQIKSYKNYKIRVKLNEEQQFFKVY